MEVTKTSNMIIPEVISDMVDEQYGRRISLLPLAEADDGLVGKPGDTLKFPAFRYIGKAEQVEENGQVQAGVLSADTVSATVKKYAKAVRITDEARLSGYGDPVGEAARQLAHAIDHAVDDALYGVLREVSYSRKAAVTAMSSESVADGLALFEDDQDGEKVLLTDAAGFNQLRRDPNYLRGGDLAQKSVFSGEVGEIWGCRIVISSAIRHDPVTKEKQHFIIKPGALRLVNKTGTQVEVQREPEYMRDTVYCSKHCAAYLYDAGKVAALTEYTGMQALDPACGIRIDTAGAEKRLYIPDDMQAATGSQWMYVTSDSTAPGGQYGTALAGARSYEGNGIALVTGGKTYAHLYLTGEDLKPVKVLTLALGV